MMYVQLLHTLVFSPTEKFQEVGWSSEVSQGAGLKKLVVSESP